MLSVPVEHPEWGKLQKCACGGIDRSRVERTRAQVLDELGALADKTFDSFALDRPFGALAYGGKAVSAATQTRAIRTALEVCRAWADAPAGWLYLYGPYGSGKSHLAAAIGHVAAERGMGVVYRSTPGLLDAFRDRETGAQALAGVIRADLLILDDMGAEKRSEWTDDRFFRLFSERAGRPTVITSNYDTEDLIRPPAQVDERIASRLSAARRVWVLASDMRKEARHA